MQIDLNNHVSLSIRRENREDLQFKVSENTEIKKIIKLIVTRCLPNQPRDIRKHLKSIIRLTLPGKKFKQVSSSWKINTVKDLLKPNQKSLTLNMFLANEGASAKNYFVNLDKQNEAKERKEKLLPLLKDYLEKNSSNPLVRMWIERGLAKIEENISVLNKLDITISYEKMAELYSKYGIIVLREPDSFGISLFLYCGDKPIYSSAMDREYSKEARDRHNHGGRYSTTIDADILMNPSIVGLWPSDNLIEYISQFSIYRIEAEFMEPISCLFESEIQLEKGLELLSSLLEETAEAENFKLTLFLDKEASKEDNGFILTNKIKCLEEDCFKIESEETLLSARVKKLTKAPLEYIKQISLKHALEADFLNIEFLADPFRIRYEVVFKKIE